MTLETKTKIRSLTNRQKEIFAAAVASLAIDALYINDAGLGGVLADELSTIADNLATQYEIDLPITMHGEYLTGGIDAVVEDIVDIIFLKDFK